MQLFGEDWVFEMSPNWICDGFSLVDHFLEEIAQELQEYDEEGLQFEWVIDTAEMAEVWLELLSITSVGPFLGIVKHEVFLDL